MNVNKVKPDPSARFQYDNRAVRAGSYIPQSSLTPQSAFPGDMSAFNANNNRIALGGFGYDTSGNLTADPTTAANAMVYDAENRQTSYTKGVTNSYSYDGDGRRVRKIDSSGTTVFVYNAGGQLIAEYQSDPAPSPSGGGGTSYLTSDHLGSTRVVTKADGSVKARYDYLPFGEELGSGIGQRTTALGYSLADSTKQKFTQKERDIESGLDYFLARYYSSAQGRFTSVDPSAGSGRPIRPQSWNRYAYVLNNPMRLIDPDGLMDGDPDKPRVVVVIFYGGNTLLNAVKGGSDSRGLASTTAIINMKAGGSTEGLGESSFSDFEGQNIAQKIKNDFPDAEVKLAGPDAQPTLFNDLATNKPDNIIIEGYSAGAVSAVGLSNNLTDRGQRVDQLTTVDPAGSSNVAPIRNTGLVGDPVNYTSFPHQNKVEGAKNVPVTQAQKLGSGDIDHRTIDDVTSPNVVQRIGDKLKEIYRPQ